MAARKKIPDPAYFARRLGAFLREHHPLLEKTEGMVRERSRRAWVSAWDALQSGDSVRTALQKADSVLYKGLLFSGYGLLASPEYNHLILDLIEVVRRHIGECLY